MRTGSNEWTDGPEAEPLENRLERWRADTLTLAAEIEIDGRPRAEASSCALALRQAAVLVEMAEGGKSVTAKPT